jgi:hypothetical protein
MRRVLRHRPSPALVIACIALGVALGGTSYAAVTLPKNSVGTKQLKKNAVNSAKVKDRSLLRKDFKAGQIPAGPQGPAGPTGPQGPQGVAGTPAAQYFAHISYSGATPSIAYGTGGITVTACGTGCTDVVFPLDVSQCANLATLFDGGANGSIRKGTASGGTHVLMQATDHNNTAQDWGYDIGEFC